MKHQIFRYGTFKRGSTYMKKIFLYSQCYIITPLNHKLVYLHEIVNQFITQSKTNILNKCWFFFTTQLKHKQIKA